MVKCGEELLMIIKSVNVILNNIKLARSRNQDMTFGVCFIVMTDHCHKFRVKFMFVAYNVLKIRF